VVTLDNAATRSFFPKLAKDIRKFRYRLTSAYLGHHHRLLIRLKKSTSFSRRAAADVQKAHFLDMRQSANQ
jgi:hypothetical protein